MILYDNEKWISSKTPIFHFLNIDETDCSTNNSRKNFKNSKYQNLQIKSLAYCLQNDPSHITLLTGAHIERCNHTESDSIADITSNQLV
jgi:hypothetical protein